MKRHCIPWLKKEERNLWIMWKFFATLAFSKAPAPISKRFPLFVGQLGFEFFSSYGWLMVGRVSVHVSSFENTLAQLMIR